MAHVFSKPMFEKVLRSPDASWRYWIYHVDGIEFNWHYHPEYEVCVTIDSPGQRYVGDNVESYGDIDMVLLGPNLPHTWLSEPCSDGKPQRVYVAQLPTQWIESLTVSMPELSPLKSVLDMSQRGVKFSQAISRQAAQLFVDMEPRTPLQKLTSLMQVFQLMIEDKAAQPLSSTGYSFIAKPDASNEKIDRVIQYIHDHYTDPLTAESLAKLAHMSTNHFHRFIKKRTEQTFVELVNQLRVGKACSLLLNSDLPVSTISDMCGFNSISNFNRRFVQFKKTTPSEFRRAYEGNNKHAVSA